MSLIIPIILAGGTGSRLWPLSRESFPKQFLNLLDNNELTLLQQTYKRIEDLQNISKPIIICNEEHRFVVADQMRTIHIQPLALLLEPLRRNTAPAITIAALKVLELFKEEDIDPILLILSSDHQIEDEAKFKKAIKTSIKEAEEDKLVVFGVVPTYAATGYGYIKSKDDLKNNEVVSRKVEKFIEKPNLKTAELLFGERDYTWNSGMFVFKASEILKELESHSPETVKNCRNCLSQSTKDLDFLRLEKSSFSQCHDISIDVAVFEKTENAYVIPLECGWDDIGSWDSVWNIAKKNSEGNSIKGNVILKDTKDSLIRSDQKLAVCLGIKDLIIIETKDALLVANKRNSQDVKSIVSILNKKGFTEGTTHKKIFRPWGYYFSLQEENNFQIKKIEVNPGASLSLQMHHHRSEHWIVVSGIAKVQLNENIEILSENQSTYIPVGSKHRLSNPGKIPLIIIEVQSGDYFGEDDIIRFEDNYGRYNK